MSDKSNFLKGLCRQLRHALDEGGELAYEFAELVDECLTLIDPGHDAGDDSADAEVELPELGSDGHSQEGDDLLADGHEQGDQLGLSGVDSPVGVDASSTVPERSACVRRYDPTPRMVGPSGVRPGPALLKQRFKIGRS